MRPQFELSVALKYLVPRRKQLSVSLIALLSVAVISLVVWLVLVFLSVTEGIERGWVQKLTTLNAPLRITPTQDYYASYYYQIDALSSDSEYTCKNIAAKMSSLTTDPYHSQEDGELPPHFPEADLTQSGSLKDPVKGLFALLTDLKNTRPDLTFQDFELSGALMRLQLLRPGSSRAAEATQGYLTQVSYIATLPTQAPKLSSLLLQPTTKDLDHLLYLSTHSTELSREDSPTLTLKTDKATAEGRIRELLRTVKIKELKPREPLWQIPVALLPEKQILRGKPHFRGGKLSHIDLPTQNSDGSDRLKIWKEGSHLTLEDPLGNRQNVPLETPLLSLGPLLFNVMNLKPADSSSLTVSTTLQGVPLQGEVGLDGLEIIKADLIAEDTHRFFLPVNKEKETGVFLTKSYLDSGVRIGDRGYLSYSSATSSSFQEHRLPIFVTGFYDPGIFSVGNKCILAPSFVTETINASSSSFNLDKTQANGVLVWFDDLQSAEEIKQQLLKELSLQGIDRYWRVTTFKEYDFAKDLMQQFQSDKYLFTMVGIIILIVACCNIISMLVLLVSDKKKEIGILQAMGAHRFSIAAIFATCGMTIGILSSVLGTIGALLTLQHIDSIVLFLSYMQGHDAFNSTFFGKSLPSSLSHHATLFILITTPLIALAAGLIPAIKACRLRPAEVLRSES